MYVFRNVQDVKVMGTVMFMGWFCKLAPELSGWNEYARAFHVMNDYVTNFVNSRLQTHQVDTRRDFTDVYIDEMLKTKDPGSSFFKEEGSK
jgi:hypothetical protein